MVYGLLMQPPGPGKIAGGYVQTPNSPYGATVWAPNANAHMEDDDPPPALTLPLSCKRQSCDVAP